MTQLSENMTGNTKKTNINLFISNKIAFYALALLQNKEFMA